ncbi:MAG: (4Fe-4S)-binding protein, partial [Dehalococcoidia bacterium]
MKEVVILSGKGGTGKMSLVASFAALAQSKVLVDCDVDAADLYLLLEPQIKEQNEVITGIVDDDP